jgi:carbonic anhydrase
LPTPERRSTTERTSLVPAAVKASPGRASRAASRRALASVETVRSSPFVSDDIPVSGYIYDVKSGKLEKVVGPGE